MGRKAREGLHVYVFMSLLHSSLQQLLVNMKSPTFGQVAIKLLLLLYVTACKQVNYNCQGQLSLPSLSGMQIEYWLAWLGLRWGMLTCAWWQVALCDPIWQVML